jgi:mono/diheme cytochrome c family protein
MKRSVGSFFAVIAVGFSWHQPVIAQTITQRLVTPPASRLPLPPPDLAVPPWPPQQPVASDQPTPIAPTPVVPIPVPARPAPFTPTPPLQGAPGPLPPEFLTWDSELKEATVKSSEPAAQFVFNFTNISSSDLTINYVQTSCGCTVAQLPTLPWKIVAGTTGQIPITMSLAGKSGAVFKTITVNTDRGWKMLTVKSTILPAAPAPMTAGDRERNTELAKADRQAVFRGDCARCHVEPVVGKMGKDLYTSACGICHEAEHRATMVSDLHALPHETNAEYWKVWIAHGKVGSLMPAFAQADGGPLSDQQVASLVDYLVKTIPSKPGVPAATLPSTAAVH